MHVCEGNLVHFSWSAKVTCLFSDQQISLMAEILWLRQPEEPQEVSEEPQEVTLTQPVVVLHKLQRQA